MPTNSFHSIPVISAERQWTPPAWAVLQRSLFTLLNQAAKEFVARYARPDGTLIWREFWPGMDGSDDPYEGFQNLSLLFILGGDPELQRTARRQWEAITWQWTEYGQIYCEFDGYYDWMHHGEGSHLLYFLSMADAGSLMDRQRAIRFASLYLGHNPEAPNYDAARRLMRSPITGSRGPRFTMTAEDWSTHRPVLDHYPPPFEDIPGVNGPLCPWTDDRVYAEILSRINERMARGDVPLNLTATSLITHAYLHTGDDQYRRWVGEYLGAWEERTQRNGGITPDNVGLSDQIGEHFEGHWWGGYYGWQWPHGAFTILEPLSIAGANAVLLDGSYDHLALSRSQLDQLWNRREKHHGRWTIPHRHGSKGWYDYRPMDSTCPIYNWTLSQSPEDLERIERLSPSRKEATTNVGKGLIGNTEQWFAYIRGKNPDYPESILRANYTLVCSQLEALRSDQGDPASWDIHHWQSRTPVICEALVQLTLGAPMPLYHGGLLHAPLRYFDPRAQRPGLPDSVAALVQSVGAQEVTVVLGNLDLFLPREVILQAGTFGEHQFTEARIVSEEGQPTPLLAVGGKWLRVLLAPGAGLTLQIGLRRYSASPSYEAPWRVRAGEPPAIQRRDSHL